MFDFDILVILDTEWTSWPGFRESRWTMPGKHCEIVEMGAVKLDVHDGFREVACFETLVRPRINPRLSEYFTDLTGISQKEIEAEGVEFPDALTAFIDFTGDDTGRIGSFGGDNVIIDKNCRLGGLPIPFEESFFIDVAPILGEASGRDERTFMSSDIPAVFGFEPPGQAHRAVDDTRCIAEALRILRRRGRL